MISDAKNSLKSDIDRNFVYLLHCKDGTLYCGSAKDLKAREQLHNAGKGSKYVLAHGGGTIIYSEQFSTWGEALSREATVKQWPRARKLNLIKGIILSDRTA